MSTPSDVRADDNAGLIPDNARAYIEAFAKEKGLSTAQVVRQFLLYVVSDPLRMEDAVSAETLAAQLKQARLARRIQEQHTARVELRARYLQATVGARCGTFTHRVERIECDTYVGCLLCGEEGEGTFTIYRPGHEAVLINGQHVCGSCVDAHVPVKVRPRRDERPVGDGDVLPGVGESDDMADIPFF